MANTREGREIYTIEAPMRVAIPKSCVCRSCKHLGDLCQQLSREFAAVGAYRAVVACDGLDSNFEIAGR